jgi:hypothetical protein
MAPPGDHVVRISEIPSPRWDLALEKIADAGPLTLLDCEPPVGLQRHGGWPGADGHVHVSIFTRLEPSALTHETAERDVRVGLAHLDAAIAADARLRGLLDEYGLVCSYVFDYGNGAVRVGAVSDDGEVTLL